MQSLEKKELHGVHQHAKISRALVIMAAMKKFYYCTFNSVILSRKKFLELIYPSFTYFIYLLHILFIYHCYRCCGLNFNQNTDYCNYCTMTRSWLQPEKAQKLSN